LIRLSATDQRVIRDLHSVIAKLRAVLRSIEPDVVITHPYEGGHPDHDAVAFAVTALGSDPAVPRFQHLECAGYHEGEDGTLCTNRFPIRPLCEAFRMTLGAEERRLKRLMMSCFASQQETLRPFGCDEEWLRVAPSYDFAAPPNDRRIWYERFAWAITGTEWRARIRSWTEQGGAAGIPC
jgi:LmbE family N-acetylglucosaminyl deacetylase